MNTRPRPRWRRKAAFAAAALVLGLLLLEGGLRLVGEPPAGLEGIEPLPAALYREKMINHWVLPVGSRGLGGGCSEYGEKVLGGQTPANISGEVPISRQGFRDETLGASKAPGERRLLLLGDSSVYGAGICRLDTLAELLERGLGEGVEVINAGVPGYSSYQSEVLLRRALGHDLDGVILYNMISDFAGPLRLDDETWFVREARVMAILGRLALGRWIHWAVTGALLAGKQGEQEGHDPNTYHAHNRVMVPGYMANLRRLAGMARDAGAWIALVMPPLRPDLDPASSRRNTSYDIGSEGEAAPHRRLLQQRRQEIADGQRRAYVNEDYRSAMALVGWELEAPVLPGPRLIREAAAAGQGARQVGKPASLMLDEVHPAPAGNKVLARELIPIIRLLLATSR